VDDRATGRTCWRVSAGRGYGAGEHLLKVMQDDLARMTEAEFEQVWRK
jgi:hypothetical protein